MKTTKKKWNHQLVFHSKMADSPYQLVGWISYINIYISKQKIALFSIQHLHFNTSSLFFVQTSSLPTKAHDFFRSHLLALTQLWYAKGVTTVGPAVKIYEILCSLDEKSWSYKILSILGDVGLHPTKITWYWWNIPIFNWKYIFIHGGFSIVMSVFGKVLGGFRRSSFHKSIQRWLMGAHEAFQKGHPWIRNAGTPRRVSYQRIEKPPGGQRYWTHHDIISILILHMWWIII